MTATASAKAEPIPHDTLPFAADATLKIAARIAINAPAAKAYAAIIDLARYPEWNSFVPSAEILPAKADSKDEAEAEDTVAVQSPLAPDTHVMLHVRMKPGASFTDTEVVVSEHTPLPSTSSGDDGAVARVAWTAITWPTALRANRVMEVVSTGPAMCEFRTWEGMGGPLARVVKFMYAGTLQTRFEDWCRDLKAFCEKEAEG